MAVASNICHKFPKALVGAIKRAKYGQVDVKLGIVLGISAEAGVLYGAHIQENIKKAFGDAGSNLYVSVAFVAILAVVGILRVIGYSPIDVLVVPLTAEIGWKKILLATDGSKYSKAAAERAIDFAGEYGGELRVVSVVDVPAEFYGEAPDAVEDLINKAKGYAEDVKRQAESSGIKAETFVREGEAYRVIIDVARESGAGIIVMGSHGRTGLKRLLMGSVTEKVIGHAPCPVLVVK